MSVAEVLDKALSGARVSDDDAVELLVDPHIEPPPDLNPTLHQVLVVDDERIVEVRDYPDRACALAALERMRTLW